LKAAAYLNKLANTIRETKRLFAFFYEIGFPLLTSICYVLKGKFGPAHVDLYTIRPLPISAIPKEGRRGVVYCAIVVQSFCNRVGNARGGGAIKE